MSQLCKVDDRCGSSFWELWILGRERWEGLQKVLRKSFVQEHFRRFLSVGGFPRAVHAIGLMKQKVRLAIAWSPWLHEAFPRGLNARLLCYNVKIRIVSDALYLGLGGQVSPGIHQQAFSIFGCCSLWMRSDTLQTTSSRLHEEKSFSCLVFFLSPVVFDMFNILPMPDRKVTSRVPRVVLPGRCTRT